jgi:uncharacterized membrane protein YesL
LAAGRFAYNMMLKEAFEVIWISLRDLWEELYYLILANVIWFFLGLGVPLLLLELQNTLGFILMAVLVLFAFPPATASMYAVTSRVARATTFHTSDYFAAYKQYWWRSWLWVLANAALVLIVYIDFRFYPDFFQNVVGVALSMFFAIMFIFWAIMQVYFWPMLFVQEKPNILQAWRNSAMLVMGYPIYAIIIGLFSALVWYLTVRAYFIPAGLITMAFQGILANNAVLTLLVKMKKLKPVRPPEQYGRRK